MDFNNARRFVRDAVPKSTLDQWAEFLASIPPNVPRKFEGLVCGRLGGHSGTQLLRWLPTPDVDMHCTHEGEIRRFAVGSEQKVWIYAVNGDTERFHFVWAKCRNCGGAAKVLALVVEVPDSDGNVEIMKMGEYPPFGAPVTNELRKALGPGTGLFQKAWSAERMGLGIGAAAYYRRIVETSWKTLVADLRSAGEAIGLPKEQLARFDEAAKQTQFSNAIESLKDALPSELFLAGGINPLLLLHGSLSKDLHSMSDDECLAVATATRTLLGAMIGRLEQVRAEHEKLKDAVKKLGAPR